MDIARGELVERELNAMIERRSRQKDCDEESELWRESMERYDAHRREQHRQAWASYHEGQAERHRCILQELIAHHETQAAKLCEGEGGA